MIRNLTILDSQGVPNENWGLCNLNEKYGLCATYPKRLFVPTKAPQSVIEGSARFRSKSRLPVLTYLHKNGAAIIRCAQPLVGVSGSRSPQDEQGLYLIESHQILQQDFQLSFNNLRHSN